MTPVEVFESLGVSVITSGHHHCRRGWVQMDCPRCSPGSMSWRLGFKYSRRFPRFNCWACGRLKIADCLFDFGTTMPVGKFLSLFDSSWRDSQLEDDEKQTGIYTPPDGLLKAFPKWHRKYLEDVRRFDAEETQAVWDIGAVMGSSRAPWSIFIPIHYKGRPVSWSSRSIAKTSEVRYISATPSEETILHKSILYGLDKVKHTVIIHEGLLDVWRTGPGAVATFGTAILQSQIGLLSRIPRRVICLDSDRPGRRASKALADALSLFPGETYRVELQSAKDADGCSLKELKQLRSFLR